jgi:hypothetical protein
MPMKTTVNMERYRLGRHRTAKDKANVQFPQRARQRPELGKNDVEMVYALREFASKANFVQRAFEQFDVPVSELPETEQGALEWRNGYQAFIAAFSKYLATPTSEPMHRKSIQLKLSRSDMKRDATGLEHDNLLLGWKFFLIASQSETLTQSDEDGLCPTASNAYAEGFGYALKAIIDPNGESALHRWIRDDEMFMGLV